MEYYPELKINEISSCKKKNLKCILLIERSWSKKATYCKILIVWLSGKCKTMKTINRSVPGIWELGRDE